MSYYSRHDSGPSFSWEFFALCILLLIALLFIRSCSSSVAWNNGICSYCGGHYKFQQAIGHQHTTDYLYTCDTCGRSIEVAEHYMEVQDEITE